jgi:hypothetical protein
VLMPAEQSILVNFRTESNLPLNKCHHYLRQIFPWLTRSTMYRCFLRYDVGRIADRPCEMSAVELSRLLKECSERAKIFREYRNMYAIAFLRTVCK